METWLILFIAGFIGSLHCVGMCGGIVCAYSLSMEKAGAGRAAGVAAQLLYNTGRLTTYTLLGATAGVLGQTFTGFGQWQGMARGLAVGAGVLMVVIGLGYLGLFPKLLDRESAGGFSASFKRLAALMTRPGPLMGLPIGMGMGFLPCGLVYAMLIKAAGTASPLDGGLVMLSFGLGTFPALFFVGTSFHKLSEKLRGGAMKAAAVAVILVGLLTIWRGFTDPMTHANHMHQPGQANQENQPEPEDPSNHPDHSDYGEHHYKP